MFCTNCGKENPDSARFCFSCGQPVQTTARTQPTASSLGAGRPQQSQRSTLEPPETVDWKPLPRPTVITILSLWNFFAGTMLVLVGLAAVAGSIFASMSETPFLAVVGVICFACGALELVCAVGLWGLRSYGRTIQLVFSWLGLLAFPLGTIFSIAVIVYLNKPGSKVLFSGTFAPQLTAEERAQVAALSQGALGTAIIVMLVALVLIPGIGIVAAVAVPGLLRARMSGNEASAIGALRAINTAQQNYSQQCNGYAPSLTELRAAGNFLSPDLASAQVVVRNGFTITMVAASGAAAIPQPPVGCIGTTTNYYATAVPTAFGSTGTRSFATSEHGTIFYTKTAFPPADPIPVAATPIQ